jgi:tRNA(Ile)-lysidine synthase
MLHRVSDYIAGNNLIQEGDRIAVGVSGGPDSVCLLHILNRLYGDKGGKNVGLFAVHVNHCIRGKEADLDEEFVKSLCRDMGIVCKSFRIDVKSKAREEGLTEEEAGRLARHRAFVEACREFGCNKIAVAHNMNDNAETFLHNLFRGSGLRGLSGIASLRSLKTEAGDITIIRPLLFLKRNEIENYLKSMNIPYRIDASNSSDDYTRNRLRNRVLGYVEDNINERAAEHINLAIAQLSEAQAYIDRHVKARLESIAVREGDSYLLPSDALLKEDIVIRKGIILNIMEELAGSRKDIEAKHVEEILSLIGKQTGKEIHLPYGMLAVREYNGIRLILRKDHKVKSRKKIIPEPIPLKVPCKVILEEKGMIIEARVIPYEKDKNFSDNNCIKWFDYDKIENTVELRTRQEGDFIQINQSGGHKKLKNLLIDEKVPAGDRSSLLLVADGSHIMWIPEAGSRMSEKYKISESTVNILHMSITYINH